MSAQTVKPLIKAFRTAFEPPETIKEYDIGDLGIQLEEIDLQIKIAKDLKDNHSKSFFGFESPEKEIKDHLRTLYEKKQALEEKIEAIHFKSAGQQMHIEMAKKGYPQQMSPEFLTARKKDGTPTFMVMDLKSKSVAINIYKNLVIFEPNLPDLLEKQLKVAVEKLQKKLTIQWGLHESTRIVATYTGIVPTKARVEIQKAIDSRLFNKIFVVAEAPKWDRYETYTAKGDPLVLGWVEKTQQLFVITIFDPTSIEQYVLDQFATGVTTSDK